MTTVCASCLAFGAKALCDKCRAFHDDSAFRATYRREAPRKWPRRLARLGLAALGVAVMALEGAHQPSPGVGFGVALALFMVAAIWEGPRHG